MPPETTALQVPLTPIVLERSAETGAAIVLVLEDEATFARLTGRRRRAVESLLEVSVTTIAVGDRFETTAELHSPGAVPGDEIAAALVLSDDATEVVINLTPTDATLTRWTGHHSQGSKPIIGSFVLRTVLA